MSSANVSTCGASATYSKMKYICAEKVCGPAGLQSSRKIRGESRRPVFKPPTVMLQPQGPSFCYRLISAETLSPFNLSQQQWISPWKCFPYQNYLIRSLHGFESSAYIGARKDEWDGWANPRKRDFSRSTTELYELHGLDGLHP